MSEIMSVHYLSSAETNHQVSNKGVLGFSRTVAHHHTPTVLLGQFTPEGRGSIHRMHNLIKRPLHEATCQHLCFI